jgi:uncharacterized protein
VGNSSPDRQLGATAALVLCFVLTIIGALIAIWKGFGGHALAFTFLALFCLLAGEIIPATRGATEFIRKIFPPQIAWLLGVALLLMWIVYALGTTGIVAWRAQVLVAYILLPIALLSLARNSANPTVFDYLAWIAIALPMRLHWLTPLWPYPTKAGYGLGMLLLVNVGVIGFLFVRRLDGVGYSIGWGRGWTLNLVGSFLVTAAIVVPIGLYTKFLHWAPGARGWKNVPGYILGILVFTAWLEEFLFRGLLQNMLARTMRSEKAGWITASILFGLTHIVVGQFPNWRYFLLASIAGFFYGYVWRKTGSIFASAILHACVDTLWHALFK